MVEKDGREGWRRGVMDKDGIHDLCLLLGIKWLPIARRQCFFSMSRDGWAKKARNKLA